jgi:hypothetical protein
MSESALVASSGVTYCYTGVKLKKEEGETLLLNIIEKLRPLF